MPKHYQLIVLGSGAVGQTVAYAARKAKQSVAVVETQAPGGTCPNRGCDAKKPYVNAAAMAHRARRLADAGGGISAPAMDWAQVAAFKKSFTDPVGDFTTRDLHAAGIDILAGRPAFDDPNTLTVNGQTLTADQFVLATGQRPRTLDFPGGDLALDSDAFLDLDDLPDHVAFIGGGYVGMEFACAAAVAGRRVTIITPGPHVLKGFDEDVVQTLEAALPTLGSHGVTLLANQRAGRITRADAGLTVHTNDPDATPLVTADLVVNATGRVASVDGMHLDRAGIDASPRGVVVDDHLRCPGNPRAWAGGDVADNGRPPLIPTAVDDARTLKHNLFADDADLHSRSTQPLASVAFTLPPVAGAGLTEAEARAQHGDTVRVHAGDLSTKKYFRQLGQAHASYKLVFDAKDRLLGAHLAGESADEVINVFALALGQRCDASALCAATLTYPSVTAAVQTAFRKASHR